MAKITTTTEGGGSFDEPREGGEWSLEKVLDDVHKKAEEQLPKKTDRSIGERILKESRQESASDPRQQFDQANTEYEQINNALRLESADSNPQLEISRNQLNNVWEALMDKYKELVQKSSFGNTTNDDERMFVGFVRASRDIFAIIRQRHKIIAE